jgi:hypothetical protein
MAGAEDLPGVVTCCFRSTAAMPYTNQLKLDQRGGQVKMLNIYPSATPVIIWLALKSDKSTLAME